MNSKDSVVAWPLNDRKAETAAEGGSVGGHWLTLAEAARRLDVPASSVRGYIEHHDAFVEVMHFGQRTLVGRSSLPTLEAIHRCYQTGAGAEAVNKEMARRRGRAARPEAAERPARREVVLPSYDVANEVIGLQREVREVRRALGELREALAARDEALRTVLAALAELVATQDNERRIAEGERDRLNAAEHRATLDAVNELVGLARRRRWRS
jgi:hypothetical protein